VRNLTTDLTNLVQVTRELNPRLSAAQLRQRLVARAEALAADSYGLTTRELAQSPGVRRQLWEIVGGLVPAEASPHRLPPLSIRDQRPADEDDEPRQRPADDDDKPRRCECVYCHSLHAAGTFSLPYYQPACQPTLPTLPTLPTMGSYAVTPYYAVPYGYAPRRHPLHGLFCPCTWCRGW
jgi:hypothetical protein